MADEPEILEVLPAKYPQTQYALPGILDNQEPCHEKPSPTQEKALSMMRGHGGRIMRWKGGFWTVPDAKGIGYITCYPIPDWWINIQTVRAMERKGLIVRENVYPEEWRDLRRLVLKDQS